MLGYKKGNTKLLTGQIPLHYPADRVYLDGDPTKSVQDKVARKADLTNLDLTGTTNTTGSTIASGTYFYLNGVLVRAKTAIASGATFTLNTNYEVVTVGDALNSVTEQISQEILKHLSTDCCIRTMPNMGKRTFYIAPTSTEQIFFIVLAPTNDTTPRGIVLRTVSSSGTVARIHFTYVFGSGGDCTISGSEVIVPHSDWAHAIIISNFNFTTRTATA